MAKTMTDEEKESPRQLMINRKNDKGNEWQKESMTKIMNDENKE
jgi:hypothetical protein